MHFQITETILTVAHGLDAAKGKGNIAVIYCMRHLA